MATSTTALNLGAATIDFNGTGIIQYADGSAFTIQDDSTNVILVTDATNNLTLGDSAATVAINSSDWDIDASGDMTNIGAITADGAISFDPTGAADISFVVTQGDGSYFNITGLTSSAGDSLCLDSSNNVITCSAGSGSSPWTHIDHALFPDDYWADDLIIGGNSTASATFQVSAATGDTRINTQGDLRLYDSDNTQYTGFQAPSDVTGNSVYTMPVAYPGSSSFLKTTSGGTLTWDTSTYDDYDSWDLSGDSGSDLLHSRSG